MPFGTERVLWHVTFPATFPFPPAAGSGVGLPYHRVQPPGVLDINRRRILEQPRIEKLSEVAVGAVNSVVHIFKKHEPSPEIWRTRRAA